VLEAFPFLSRVAPLGSHSCHLACYSNNEDQVSWLHRLGAAGFAWYTGDFPWCSCGHQASEQAQGDSQHPSGITGLSSALHDCVMATQCGCGCQRACRKGAVIVEIGNYVLSRKRLLKYF
jgi:hypothetical protein